MILGLITTAAAVVFFEDLLAVVVDLDCFVSEVKGGKKKNRKRKGKIVVYSRVLK